MSILEAHTIGYFVEKEDERFRPTIRYNPGFQLTGSYTVWRSPDTYSTFEEAAQVAANRIIKRFADLFGDGLGEH